MAGIGNVNSSSSSDHAGWLEKLRESQKTEGSGATGGAIRAATKTSAEGLAALRDQIKSELSAALRKLDKTASADQVMQAINNTIDATLRANGISMGQTTRSEGAEAAAAVSSNPQGGQNAVSAMIDSILQQNGFDPKKIRDESSVYAKPSQAEPSQAEQKSNAKDVLSFLFSQNSVNTVA
jgi:hypothetical protein